MNPIEALNILALATEPGVKLNRVDYVRVQQALETLKPIAEEAAKPKPEPAKPSP